MLLDRHGSGTPDINYETIFRKVVALKYSQGVALVFPPTEVP
jgi:hypothetical protein